ncbi:MAG: sulfatase-like hydrolase/transferase [Pseudomonadota bacterium]
MLRRILIAAGYCVGLLACQTPAPTASPASSSPDGQQRVGPPNLLLIVADDLGFTDLGAFGGEIATPHLDRLAYDGLRLTNFHTAPSCAPSRAMLMTGTDNHVAGMGSQGSLTTPLQSASRAYANRLLPEVPTVTEYLRELGYRNLAAAKWHLGKQAESLPNARAFDRSFVLLQGGGGHFDATPLFESYGRSTWLEDDAPVALPADFYSSDYMTSKLIAYLEKGDSEQPWFAYLGYTAPHWPLQAPAAAMAPYADTYLDGWDALRERRMRGARAAGVVPAHAQAVAFEPGMVAWDTLTPARQRVESKKMQAYAGMVARLDANVGKLLATLRARGDLDNTVIVFLADNGAEGHDMETYGSNAEWLPATFDNSLDAIGTRASYVSLGPAWARATAAPFRDSKSKMSEGGIRVPAFVHMPGGRRGINDAYMRIMDLAPTFIAMAGGELPQSMMGRSLVGALTGDGPGTAPYAPDEVIAAEAYGRRMAQRGHWKILRQDPPYGTGEWQLYDLETDPGEQDDLSDEFPARRAELINAWRDYADRVGVIDPEIAITY